jgi:hypothetical protein
VDDLAMIASEKATPLNGKAVRGTMVTELWFENGGDDEEG